MTTFSRSLVMQRYHHDVSLRENLLYRWKLYKVRIYYCFPLAHPVATLSSLVVVSSSLCTGVRYNVSLLSFAVWTCLSECSTSCLW